MRRYLQKVGRAAVFAALFSVSSIAPQCLAQEDASVLVAQPVPPAAEQPVLSPPRQNAVAEPLPAPAATQEMVQPAPPIKYRVSRSARRLYRGQATVELVMVARNPADCCLYEIPLCLPACCLGEPRVEERRGIAGRGVVEYCWECGFTATVKFRKRIGDVKVEYDT